MANQDDILGRLMEDPLVSVAVGAVIGGIVVSILTKKKNNPDIDKRMKDMDDKLKKIQEAEAKLALD